jgi:hypothetical protein
VEAVLRTWCVLIGVGLLGACAKSKPDVLKEFPPPRLAKEIAEPTASVYASPAECTATWRLIGRKHRLTYQVPGSGQFRVRGESLVPVSGEVRFDVTGAEPRLPSQVDSALRSRDASGGWSWRVVQSNPRQASFDDEAPRSNPDVRVVSEVELNAVRTRQSHVVSSKLTKAGDAATLETTLRLDLSAHHVRGLMVDETPVQRAEMLIRCRLSTPVDAD